MKHLLLITILLILPTSIDETDRPSQLELEIIEDNPGFHEWSYEMQMKVKEIYIKFRY